jgi:hypothetical protein
MDADVVARVIDIKSASEEQPAHRVQVAIYSALLEQTLAEGPGDTATCRIETSVLTQATAADSSSALHPFDMPCFRRAEWELFAEQLLAAGGPLDDALSDPLSELPFALDQVCDNCAYKEACATRAVEDPTAPASLALLGLDASVQRALRECGLSSIRALSTLLSRQSNPQPTDDPPAVDMPAEQRRTLEETLPGPIHETVQRAQAIRGEIDPSYESFTWPPAITGTDWLPLPDDRCAGWGNIDDAQHGELIHVAVFVRPDTTIDRIAALGACVYAEADGEYHTIGEVIDAVPDEPAVATTAENALLERFTQQLFGTIETVASALGDPTEAVVHGYTYTDHETEALAEGLDRHTESCQRAHALRQLLSLDENGHTGVDQDLWSAVQPIINEHFALKYPSQGLLAVADQFVPGWTLEAFDPLDARPDDPPLRAIFDAQFLSERVPYLADGDSIHLHLARGPLGEGPAAAIADDDRPSPDGWYPIRKRAGGQFPIEYVWAAVPRQPSDTTPRLTPALVEEWGVDDEHRDLYRQELERFAYRTGAKEEALQRADLTYLVERLSYTLCRLVEAIPYKDAYHSKAPLDATRLSEFELPVNQLPAAARDYLRMEHGAAQDATVDHYRQSLRARARSGRSIPIRCTDVTSHDDGSLTITGTLAYETLFDDPATATQVARQARVRSADGSGSGSWRVLTRLHSPDTSTVDDTDDPSARAATAAAVDNPESIKHSPPVLVEALDHQTGTITLTAFPHRFRRAGSRFRVDHCGWVSPSSSNLDTPDAPVTDRPGYVAGRPPVQIDPGAVFMLDPMVDDFGAPKADRALQPDTVEKNALWQTIQTITQTGQQPAIPVCSPPAVDAFLETLAETDSLLTPNADQEAFIRATDRALVPLQGPPGTGKTDGATAPALLARAFARAQHDRSFFGVVVAPSHEAVDAVLSGVVDLCDDWRHTSGGLEAVELVRVLPAEPPAKTQRADAIATAVDVTYCNYHSADGEKTLQRLARTHVGDAVSTAAQPEQCLLFATPATLYRVLGVVAETVSAIDGSTAPAAMRHEAGLADVVCLDEASMLDVPGLFLAGSALTPTGQTLLVGDHRQLATVTQVDWTDTRRKPLEDTQAYRSALAYVRWLNRTVTLPSGDPDGPPDSDDKQSSQATHTDPADTAPSAGGDDDDA